MTPEQQFSMGMMAGKLMSYGTIIVIIVFIGYLIYKSTAKKKVESVAFAPENPEEIWNCPECNHENKNITFKCGRCDYKIQ